MITITVRDAAGNVATKTLNLVINSTPPADPNPSPQTGNYTTYGTRNLTTAGGVSVLLRYPTVSGVMAVDRPVVIIGHGMGMDPAVAQSGHQYLVKAGYVVAVPNIGASTNYLNLARIIKQTVDAILADSTLAPGVLPNRIGYTGGSQGGITGIALQDPTVRDPRIKCFVLRCARVSGSNPSWTNAPPLLFIHGTADNTIPYSQGMAAYTAATAPKGFITLPGAGHDMIEPTPTNIVQEATKAFFSRFLGGVSTGLNGIQTAVNNDVNRPTYIHDWTLDA